MKRKRIEDEKERGRKRKKEDPKIEGERHSVEKTTQLDGD